MFPGLTPGIALIHDVLVFEHAEIQMKRQCVISYTPFLLSHKQPEFHRAIIRISLIFQSLM